MVRFLADEDFNRAIVRGASRLRPEIDIVRVQDVGLRTQPDPDILEWAASEGRILLTHDAKTMPTHAYGRVLNAKPMPGVFIVDQEEAVSKIIQDVILISDGSVDGEWEGQVRYLPL